jgi:hypothetical protein
MGQTLFEAADNPKYFHTVEGAGHNDTFVVGGDAYFEAFTEFVKNSRL